MTRQRKSRKPGSFEAKTDSKKQKRPSAEESKHGKKVKGRPAGNRNSLVVESKDKTTATGEGAARDPRHGSKKPISLTPESPKQVELTEFQPKVRLTKVKAPSMTPEQELEAIESDERLLALLERKENDELLTGKDAKYFNAKMTRHQELTEILGLDLEDDDEDEAAYDIDDTRSLVEQWEDDDRDDQ